jgi:membrane protein required for colicin V production
MNSLDIILIILVGVFTLAGFWFGLIHTIGSLLGTMIGSFVAGLYYIYLANWLGGIFGESNTISVISFVIIFILVNRTIGLLVHLVDRIFKIVSIIPFLKTINRLAGAILGFIEGALVIGIFLYVSSRYPMGDWFMQSLIDSVIAHWLIFLAKVITPLLPAMIRQLKAVI